MNVNLIKSGDVKFSPQFLLLRQAILTEYSQKVSVPVSVSYEMIAFDVETILQRTALSSSISRDAIDKLLHLMGSTLGEISAEDINGILGGYDIPPAKIASVIKSIQDAIVKNMTSGSFSSIFHRLKTEESLTFKNFSKLSNLNQSDISAGIEAVQRLYTKLSFSEPAESIAEYITNVMFANPAIRLIQFMHRIFYQATGSQLSVNKGFVMNQIFTSLFKTDKYLEITPRLPGVLYDVEQYFFDDDLTYQDLLGVFMSGLRIIMNLPITPGPSNLSVADLTEDMLWGSGQQLPILPADVGSIETKRVDSMITKMWLWEMMSRMISHNTGVTQGKFEGILDARKYGRNDAFDTTIRSGIMFGSVLYDSLIAISQTAKTLVTDENIYYPTIHPRKRTKLNQFIFEYLKPFSSFQLTADNPRTLNDPANLMSAAASSAPSTEVPSFSFLDSQLRDLPTPFITPSFDTVAYLTNDIIQGSQYDAANNVDPRLWSFAKRAVATYFISMPNPLNELGFSKFVEGFAIKSVKDLTATDLSEFLKPYYQVIFVLDSLQLSQILEIPLAAANVIYKKYSPKLDTEIVLVKFNASAQVMVAIDAIKYPVYELHVNDQSLTAIPFVGRYPYFSVLQVSLNSGLSKHFTVPGLKGLPSGPSDSPYSINQKTQTDEAKHFDAKTEKVEDDIKKAEDSAAATIQQVDDVAKAGQDMGTKLDAKIDDIAAGIEATSKKDGKKKKNNH